MDVVGLLYAPTCAILYRGPEHPWSWVSAKYVGSWNQFPTETRNDLSFGGVYMYTQIFNYVTPHSWH